MIIKNGEKIKAIIKNGQIAKKIFKGNFVVYVLEDGTKYVRVNKDVLWVTPWEWEQFLIESNVDWEIK